MRVIYDYYLRFRVRGQVASETLENLPLRFMSKDYQAPALIALDDSVNLTTTHYH